MPKGPFDLVVSAFAIHHLSGEGKARLFQRIREELERFHRDHVEPAVRTVLRSIGVSEMSPHEHDVLDLIDLQVASVLGISPISAQS